MERCNEVDAGGFKPTTQEEIISQSTHELEFPDLEFSFGRFTENKNYREDELEYPRNGTEPGLVIIFNLETFGTSLRQGSSKDVEDIITCLARLGFNIIPKYIFNDLTKEEIFINVSDILDSDLSEVNSVLVFVLTHGLSSNILCTSTGNFVADDLWIEFAKCPSLTGKPKMFIIQACKGKEFTRFSSEPEDTSLVSPRTFSSQNIYPDMLIVFSTMEGKFSLRNTELGSWLIQELCKNFSAYGRRDDVLTLLTRVSKCICRNYYTGYKREIVKQLPVVVSTLSKKFYLNKNKDRHLVLTMLEKQDKVLKKIRSISEKVASIHTVEEKNNDN